MSVVRSVEEEQDSMFKEANLQELASLYSDVILRGEQEDIDRYSVISHRRYRISTHPSPQ